MGRYTVTHILIASKNPQLPKVTRSKAEALTLAKSVLQDIVAGRSFEDLVLKFTDDLNKEGKPNTNNGKPGSYDFTDQDRLAPEFAAAMKALKPGEMTKEPVGTMFGYHIIRRDK